MIIKPVSALLIVAFGQINFLLQNHESSREKIKEFHQKKFEKTHDLKEEKDAKKNSFQNFKQATFSAN